jgi:hypothetical protein
MDRSMSVARSLGLITVVIRIENDTIVPALPEGILRRRWREVTYFIVRWTNAIYLRKLAQELVTETRKFLSKVYYLSKNLRRA